MIVAIRQLCELTSELNTRDGEVLSTARYDTALNSQVVVVGELSGEDPSKGIIPEHSKISV